MVGDFGWEHEGPSSRIGTVKEYIFSILNFLSLLDNSSFLSHAMEISKNGS